LHQQKHFPCLWECSVDQDGGSLHSSLWSMVFILPFSYFSIFDDTYESQVASHRLKMIHFLSHVTQHEWHESYWCFYLWLANHNCCQKHAMRWISLFLRLRTEFHTLRGESLPVHHIVFIMYYCISWDWNADWMFVVLSLFLLMVRCFLDPTQFPLPPPPSRTLSNSL
jgi:hypothetical protein